MKVLFEMLVAQWAYQRRRIAWRTRRFVVGALLAALSAWCAAVTLLLFLGSIFFQLAGMGSLVQPALVCTGLAGLVCLVVSIESYYLLH